MKKSTLLIPLILAFTLAACGSRATPNSSGFGAAPQNGTTTGALSETVQIALGTPKLDGTQNDLTPDQATELIPLWETLRLLETSDTASQKEIEALDAQIKETMTANQIQAITAMNLTRQDMLTILQAQGGGNGFGQQANNGQGRNTSGNGNGNRQFGGGGGFVPGAGGPPDGGGFQGGGQGFGGQNQNRSAEQIATAQAARQAGGGNRIPAPLLNAVIEFLKQKAGS